MNGVVSIIVPAYNISGYIERCVNSLLNQTYPKLEILLIDDGSTDATGKLCDALAERDARVRVIHKKNSGVSDSRNIGIEHATGEWIAFVDGDDWLELNCYEELLRRYADYDMILMNYRNAYDDGTFDAHRRYPEICARTEEERRRVIRNSYACETEDGAPYRPPVGVIWNRVIRRSVFEQHKLRFHTKLTNHEDLLFTLLENEAARSIAICDDPFYNHFIRKDSAVRRYNPGIEQNNDIACREMDRYLETYHPDDPFFAKAVKQYHVGWFYQILELSVFHDDSTLSFGQRVRELKRLAKKAPYCDAFDVLLAHASKGKRVFCFCIRHHFYILIALMLTLRNKAKKTR